jgi:hypothetical protein
VNSHESDREAFEKWFESPLTDPAQELNRKYASHVQKERAWSGWRAATENKAGKLTDARIDQIAVQHGWSLDDSGSCGEALRSTMRAIEAEIRSGEPDK